MRSQGSCTEVLQRVDFLVPGMPPLQLALRELQGGATCLRVPQHCWSWYRPHTACACFSWSRLAFLTPSTFSHLRSRRVFDLLLTYRICRPAPASSARAAVPQLTDGQQAVAQQIGSQQHQHQQQVPYALQQQLHQAQQLQAAQSVGRHIDSQFHIPFGELVFHRVIGHGSFKTVYRGRWRNTNVAIMRMREGGLLTEARLMQKLSTHPNLVQFYRWSHDTQGNEYIILELMPLGSLDKILLRFGSVLRTSMKLSMAEQIAAAMAELASEGVLHRDLAARNVLVQSLEPVHVKVADFGLAHQFANGDTANHTSSHTHGALLLSGIPVRWCSPEVLSHQAWSKASDVWAFGVTLWEVFADGTEPYAALTDQEVCLMLRLYLSACSGPTSLIDV
eukprot:GHUV01036732.1.p1 GENE.GHUV01036732.1~~GHUV01036732.1.p1  ORF type:complete len:392 (+),score=83.38 GHUV01036732.1:634-1809(+)